jgi:hypothetical protein
MYGFLAGCNMCLFRCICRCGCFSGFFFSLLSNVRKRLLLLVHFLPKWLTIGCWYFWFVGSLCVVVSESSRFFETCRRPYKRRQQTSWYGFVNMDFLWELAENVVGGLWAVSVSGYIREAHRFFGMVRLVL